MRKAKTLQEIFNTIDLKLDKLYERKKSPLVEISWGDIDDIERDVITVEDREGNLLIVEYKEKEERND